MQWNKVQVSFQRNTAVETIYPWSFPTFSMFRSDETWFLPGKKNLFSTRACAARRRYRGTMKSRLRGVELAGCDAVRGVFSLSFLVFLDAWNTLYNLLKCNYKYTDAGKGLYSVLFLDVYETWNLYQSDCRYSLEGGLIKTYESKVHGLDSTNLKRCIKRWWTHI